MRISYIERNGRRYAYTCTSHRVPGKKNPVSERVYLGVVDPDTGEIVPKKGSNADRTRFSGGFTVKNAGDVVLVKAVADRLGIPKSLDLAFGGDSTGIMAVIVAQAIRPSPLDTTHLTIQASYIGEILGLDPSLVCRDWVHGTLRRIGRAGVERFVKSRLPDDMTELYVCFKRVSLTDEASDQLFDIPEMSRRLQVCIVFLVIPDGSIVGFDTVRDPLEDTSEIVDMVHGLQSQSIRPILVLGPTESPYVNLSELVRRGIDIVSVFPIQSSQYRHAVSHMDPDAERRRGPGQHGRTCISETDAGLSSSSDIPAVFMPDEPGFGSCRSHLRASLFLDHGMSGDARHAMDVIVQSIRMRLEGKVSDDPERSLRDAAGPLADLFRVSVNQQDVMHVSVRRERMRDFRRNAGMFLTLSTSSDRMHVETALSLREHVDEAVRQFLGGSQWVYRYTGNNTDTMYAQMFVQFVVETIYNEILRLSSDTGEDLDVEDLLFRASMSKVAVTPTGNYPSSSDRWLVRVLSELGVTRQSLTGRGG